MLDAAPARPTGARGERECQVAPRPRRGPAALHETAGPRPVPRLIHVMDREADAYEVMMAVVDAGDSAVIRCAQNRRIDDPLGTAHQAVRRQPVLGCTTVPVGRSAAGAPARLATVALRSMAVDLVPDWEKYPHAWPMRWNLVELVEPDPPPGAEPVHWYLWTLEPAATAAEVLEVVRKYTCRWPIEEMHLVLKSGCQAEALRLETWDRLEKAVTLQSAVAARIVALRDRGGRPPRPRPWSCWMRRRPRRWPVTSAAGWHRRHDDWPGGLVDRSARWPPQSDGRRDAGCSDLVAWAS